MWGKLTLKKLCMSKNMLREHESPKRKKEIKKKSKLLNENKKSRRWKKAKMQGKTLPGQPQPGYHLPESKNWRTKQMEASSGDPSMSDHSRHARIQHVFQWLERTQQLKRYLECACPKTKTPWHRALSRGQRLLSEFEHRGFNIKWYVTSRQFIGTFKIHIKYHAPILL